MPKIMAGHELHDDVERVPVLAVVVDVDDVGVRDGGGDARLALEARDERLVRGVLRPQHLDRHGAPEGGVAPAVGDREVSLADRFGQLVAAADQIGAGKGIHLHGARRSILLVTSRCHIHNARDVPNISRQPIGTFAGMEHFVGTRRGGPPASAQPLQRLRDPRLIDRAVRQPRPRGLERPAGLRLAA